MQTQIQIKIYTNIVTTGQQKIRFKMQTQIWTTNIPHQYTTPGNLRLPEPYDGIYSSTDPYFLDRTFQAKQLFWSTLGDDGSDFHYHHCYDSRHHRHDHDHHNDVSTSWKLWGDDGSEPWIPPSPRFHPPPLTLSHPAASHSCKIPHLVTTCNNCWQKKAFLTCSWKK